MISNSTSGSDSTAADGITGGYSGDSISLKIFIALFTGLSIYNAIELIILVFTTFVQYQGAYFWSLLIASAGVIPYSIGFLLKFFDITTSWDIWISITLFTIGWYTMVTGQSLVLWSRLHLILSGTNAHKVLQWTMWMIIIDALIFHIPTTILTIGCNANISEGFLRTFNVYEKVQMVGFSVQELILSAIYIYNTISILRSSLQVQSRTILYQLFAINIVIVMMDIALLGFEFANLYILEATFKGFVYSVKLKLEFAVLGKLVQLVKRSQSSATGAPTLEFTGTDMKQDEMPDLIIRKGNDDPETKQRKFESITRKLSVKPTHESEKIVQRSRSMSSRSNASETQLFEHYERVIDQAM